MIDFPPNPSDGDTYDDPTGSRWIYDVNYWIKQFDSVVPSIEILNDVGDVSVDVIAGGSTYLKYNGTEWLQSTWQNIPNPKYVHSYEIGARTLTGFRNNKWKFAVEIKDDENQFNTSTNKITVQVTGYYNVFVRHNNSGQGNVRFGSYLMRNNHRVFTLCRDYRQYEYMVARDTILFLNAGDILHVESDCISSNQYIPQTISGTNDYVRNGFQIRLLEATLTRPVEELIGYFATYDVDTITSVSLEAGSYRVEPMHGGVFFTADIAADGLFVQWSYIPQVTGWRQSWDMRYYSPETGTVASTSAYWKEGSTDEAIDAVNDRIDYEIDPSFTLTYTQTVNFDNNKTGWVPYPGGYMSTWALWKINS